MRLRANDGVRGRLIDLDTGLEVPKVIWWDAESGMIEAYRVDSRGKVKHDRTGAKEKYLARGRFRFVPDRTTGNPNHLPGALRCARCGSHLTLQGDELCAPCRSKDRGLRHPMRVERLTSPLFDVKCSTCSRRAEWAVGDEVIVSPGLIGKVTFERGASVGRRYYCSFHYAPPRLLDQDGEVISDIEQSVRPQ